MHYQGDNRGTDIGELDATCVQSSNQQLSVLSSVLVLDYIVRLRHFLLQHQHHLRINTSIDNVQVFTLDVENREVGPHLFDIPG